MGEAPNPTSSHESSAEPGRSELSRALDRAEHRRLEQRILADRLLEEAARRPTDAGVSVEILRDVPSEPPAPPTVDRRKPLWIALAVASVIAPVALTITLSRATAEAPAATTPVAAAATLEADPRTDLPVPPPIEVLPVAAASSTEIETVAPTAEPKPRAPARPRPSATTQVAPNGDKPFFELKR